MKTGARLMRIRISSPAPTIVVTHDEKLIPAFKRLYHIPTGGRLRRREKDGDFRR